MSYYNQNQPPVGNPPPQGYPPQDYHKDAYPPPGYPPQGYPQPGYPPQGVYPPQYAPPPPPPQQQQKSSSGCLEVWPLFAVAVCWTRASDEILRMEKAEAGETLSLRIGKMYLVDG